MLQVRRKRQQKSVDEKQATNYIEETPKIIEDVIATIDPLPVLPGSEQDLCHENIDLVNTYLFNQGCKVHDIVCLADQSANI